MMNYVSHWDYPESGTEWPEWRGVRTKQYTYVRWLNGAEELYDNAVDPYQLRNLWDGHARRDVMVRLRSRLAVTCCMTATTIFPPGTKYAEWFNAEQGHGTERRRSRMKTRSL